MINLNRKKKMNMKMKVGLL